jgi:hypothetical protein
MSAEGRRSAGSTGSAGSETGRRSAVRRALSPTAVIAVLLPLLTVGALALVQPDEVTTPDRAAAQVPPSRVDLVCPAGEGEDELSLATAGRAGGDVETSTPRDREPSPVRLRPDTVERLGEQDPTFVRGSGPIAAELLASRTREAGLAATECVLPRPDYWFTGLGAGAEHSSTLELANPDQGPAVADVTVWSRTGVLDVPTLRGVTVLGGESQELDLSEVVPRRGELAVHVEVSRGRLGASVVDEVPALGRAPRLAGWLPAAPEPSTDQVLLGLVEGDGTDTLVLGNPGDDEARVELRVVTEDASFVPEGQEEIRVAAGSVETVTLTETVRQQVVEGAIGLQVIGTEPVTATLRSQVDDDLVHAQVVATSEAPTTALVPPGDARVVLGRAGGAGVAVVTAYDADGEELLEERVALTEGSGGDLALPEGARLVRVTPRRTGVAAAVVVRGDGSTVVPLRELVRYSLIPDVRPGLR